MEHRTWIERHPTPNRLRSNTSLVASERREFVGYEEEVDFDQAVSREGQSVPEGEVHLAGDQSSAIAEWAFMASMVLR